MSEASGAGGASGADQASVSGAGSAGVSGSQGGSNPSGNGGGGASGSQSGGDSSVGGSSAGLSGSAGSGGSAGGDGGDGGLGGASGGAMQGGSAGRGGTAGQGGTSGAVRCADHVIPAISSWVLSASHSDNGTSPASAVDGNLSTRWSTGVEQNNDWFQIDFGVDVAVSTVTLQLGNSPGDYPRAYQVRLSELPNNAAATPLLMGNGQQGVDTVMKFSAPAVGRYLLISQVGVAKAIWWSIAELSVVCSP